MTQPQILRGFTESESQDEPSPPSPRREARESREPRCLPGNANLRQLYYDPDRGNDLDNDSRLHNTAESSLGEEHSSMEEIKLNHILSQGRTNNPLPQIYQRHIRNAKAYLPPLPTTQQMSTS